MPTDFILNDKLSEYDLSLDTDVFCITTDGAKVMVTIGRLIKLDQQLFYDHGIQLAIVDVIYKEFNKEMSMQKETIDEGTDENQDDVSNEETDKDEHSSFNLSFSTSEMNLAMEYVKNNNLLQTFCYKKNIGNNIVLLLDC